MLTPAVHAARRAALMAHVSGPVLLVGNGPQLRNLPMNALPFRQDSSFLYFTGCHSPRAAVLMAEGRTTLFLEPPAADDGLWHGHVTPIEETGAALGFDHVAPTYALEDAVASLRGGLKALAVPDPRQTALASDLTGTPLRYAAADGPDDLIDAVIGLRRRLGSEEVDEMRRAAVVTAAAHRAAMAATRPGRFEREVAAVFDGVIAAAGLSTAYESIVTVRGEVLHNHYRGNRLEDGQLLLLDGAAESPGGYATDVTRTWPVSGRFTAQQRAVYDAVGEAQTAAIDLVRPGTRYRDVHDAASRVLARFLVDEGLLRGDPDAAVEAGAHALFFPHGVGHLIGLDVHDLENFGDRAAYAPGRARSPQFGTCYLRLDLDLEPGIAVTIEPGLYFVPAILHDPTLSARFRDQVDFDAPERWLGFGGVRTEDDVLVTDTGHDVLTADIPKSPEAIEAIVGTAQGLGIG